MQEEIPRLAAERKTISLLLIISKSCLLRIELFFEYCPATVKDNMKSTYRPRDVTDPEFLRIRKEESENTDLALR
jgi:hypothetical protein